MSIWKCPVCGSFMQHRGKCWSCAQGHTFDMARSGYVNLLPANRKHAKNPGDNAVMMRARKRFLDAGHYAPLLQALEKAAVRYGRAGGVLLDAGCGEGYYTEGVSRALEQGDLQFVGGSQLVDPEGTGGGYAGIGEVSMAALGVGDADGVAVPGEIHSVGCDLGTCRVLKVHIYHTAGGARRLVHQTALLSVVDILGILPCLCQRHRCHSAVVVVLVEDRPQQNLERRRGGQPAAGEHRRGGVGIKAGGLHAVLRQFRRNAVENAHNAGRMIRATYEAIRSQRLDAFTVTLRSVGVRLANSILLQAVDKLESDAGSIVAKAGSALTYADLTKLYGAFTDFDMTMLLASPAVQFLF